MDGVGTFAGKPAPTGFSLLPVGAGLPAKGPVVFIFMATFPGTAVHEKDDKFFVTDWRICRF
ncbi:hypothetical protein C6A77_01620 [Pseudomonas sp. AFG_SD02_1510_Pfu_092]|nr:hypothetical protein C6A77_01620 [Pseudomonas sp. AFG_SD02_1510_Pfu_092]